MNLLANETSPYLRQHRDNPVHWMPWGEAAFARARATDRPVLLSVGYAACHWCHVMAHESFENEATAALMNASFICVKLDREERPDLDALYQQSLALMGQQGGWPLTLFLTPDKKPFWGGTYFPSLPRHGLPAFSQVLRGVAESWRAERDKVDFNAASLTAALIAQDQTPQDSPPLRVEVLQRISADFLNAQDPVHGGLRGAPKFPNITGLSLLWDTYARTGHDGYRQAVLRACTQMCRGGLFDHVGGGIHRYCVDEGWLVPHFEKMLYDNAMFARLLAEVAGDSPHPLLRAALRDTLDFMARDLADDETGCLVSSLDADSADEHGHSHEGLYYIWRAEEIDALLGDHATLFKQAYDVSRFGNWEGVNILNRLRHDTALSEEEEDILRLCRKKLRHARGRRPAPARDGKVMADLNALAVSAFARAAFALGDESLLGKARDLFDAACRALDAGEGRLWHCRGHAGLLEDYANMALAALQLHGATGQDGYLAQARQWCALVMRDFTLPGQDGYCASARDTCDSFVNLRPFTDTPLPAGNALMAELHTALWLAEGDGAQHAAAQKTLAAFAAPARGHFRAMAAYLRAAWFFHCPLRISLPAQDPGFANALRALPLPVCAITRHDAPFATLCEGARCTAPLTSPAALAPQLADILRKSYRGSAND